MTLTATSRLGPYEVIAPLGAGGMGEVYKGRDTRLERTVAIKSCRASWPATPSSATASIAKRKFSISVWRRARRS